MPVDPAFAALLADPRATLRRPPPHVPMSRVRDAAKAAMRTDAGPRMRAIETHDPGVRLRLYRPIAGTATAATVFLHGGGFVMGDLDTHDAMCRTLAVATGFPVVAVDYRRAPEAPYPGAVDDACRVIDWLGRERGIAPKQIALAGDSAGAHIALMAALRPGSRVAHVGLVYPIVDPACASASVLALGDDYILTPDAMRWFWECYLGDRPDPLAAADLSVLPRTSIATAEFDPLRDEGRALAGRMRAAGVDVIERDYAGMIHGFAGMPHLTRVANSAIEDMAGDIRQALARA